MSGSAVNERMRGMTECSATDLGGFAGFFGIEVADLFMRPTAQNPRYVNVRGVTTELQLFNPDAPDVRIAA